MKNYRMAFEASVYVTFQAETETEAIKMAEQFRLTQIDGLDVEYEHDAEDSEGFNDAQAEARVYLAEESEITVEDVCEPSFAESTVSSR